MAGAVQTVGVFEVGSGKAQISGFVVHQLRKALHGAAAVNCQRDRCIVPRGKHQTVQKLLEGQHLPLLQVHGGAFNAHRFLGNPHSVQHIALLADNQRSHNFGGAGN